MFSHFFPVKLKPEGGGSNPRIPSPGSTTEIINDSRCQDFGAPEVRGPLKRGAEGGCLARLALRPALCLIYLEVAISYGSCSSVCTWFYSCFKVLTGS